LAGYSQVEAAEGLALVAWEEVLGYDVSTILRGVRAEIEHGTRGHWLRVG
jgi:hypothetical protein